MAKNAITLDRSKPYSTCHGERTPDDPHYRVHFFQAYKVGKKSTLLPFDSDGSLIPDDGKTSPSPGLVEGKQVMFVPLYNADMRALVTKLEDKMPEPEEEDDEPVIVGSDDPEAAGKQVDLKAWLRGQIHLKTVEVRAGCQAQHGSNPQNYSEAIEFLLHDIGLIPENELGAALHRFKKQV